MGQKSIAGGFVWECCTGGRWDMKRYLREVEHGVAEDLAVDTPHVLQLLLLQTHTHTHLQPPSRSPPRPKCGEVLASAGT